VLHHADEHAPLRDRLPDLDAVVRAAVDEDAATRRRRVVAAQDARGHGDRQPVEALQRLRELPALRDLVEHAGVRLALRQQHLLERAGALPAVAVVDAPGAPCVRVREVGAGEPAEVAVDSPLDLGEPVGLQHGQREERDQHDRPGVSLPKPHGSLTQASRRPRRILADPRGTPDPQGPASPRRLDVAARGATRSPLPWGR
jgi:hypothetical protein